MGCHEIPFRLPRVSERQLRRPQDATLPRGTATHEGGTSRAFQRGGVLLGMSQEVGKRLGSVG